MIKLIERQEISGNIKAYNTYNQLNKLLNVLQARELPNETIDFINQEIEQLNSITEVDKRFIKAIKEKENRIVRLLEKKHKIVPKNYYKKLWMVLGMSFFGIPMGMIYGASVGKVGYFAIGLPLGMAIGLGYGSGLDKKAFNEGRQLDFESKY